MSPMVLLVTCEKGVRKWTGEARSLSAGPVDSWRWIPVVLILCSISAEHTINMAFLSCLKYFFSS